MRSAAALLIAISFVLIIVSLPTADAATADPQPDPLPEELYPDADVIITQADDGDVLVTFKAYGDYQVTEQHPSQWFTYTQDKSKELLIRNLSQVDGKLDVVVYDVDMKKLTIFNVDSKAVLNSSVTLNFTMVSGTIGSLSLINVPNSVRQYTGTSYDSLPVPIGTANVHLDGGTIDLYNPTSHMVAITDYHLKVEPGMTVNRLYTTGENGRYSNVNVEVNGSRIGYMSNIASKIGVLTYTIESGSIDYFCIGANTEHTATRNLSNMATSYVSGDVKVHIGRSATVGNCIMGAGILNMPNKLSNGENLTTIIIHSVIIDAPDVKISNDSVFFTERRNLAYHFNYYKVGQTPYAYPIMDTYSNGGVSSPVYSETGIWDSTSSCTLPVGSILSVNTKFIVPIDTDFIISEGANVYNSDNFVLMGNLIIEGRMVNNSVIQCRQTATIEGEPEGFGVIADYVYTTSNLNVISKRTAVVIEQESYNAVDRISAVLSDENRVVTITVEGSQRIYGKEFMISLEEIDAPDEWKGLFRLDIKGIDRSVLSLCSVEVTLPTDKMLCTAIYVLNQETGQYEIVATSEYEPSARFSAGIYTNFYVTTYTSDRPPPPQPSIVDDMKSIDYILIIAIVAVLAATIYLLVTMKRD